MRLLRFGRDKRTSYYLALIVSVIVCSAVAIIFVAASVCAVEQEETDCSKIISDPINNIKSGRLNEDLSPLLLDYSPGTCPHKSEGKDIGDVCKGTSPSVVPLEVPPNQDWNGVDFEYELLQLFLNEDNYQACKDIFDDPAFKNEILKIPPISGKLIDYYRYQSISRRVYFESNSKSSDIPYYQREFDDLQLRIFSVFHSISSWNYCASPRLALGLNGYGRVLGLFDPLRRIVLFDGVCTSADIYGFKISKITATHRAMLIAAHELGHAIDALSRPEGSQLSGRQQEARATFLATYIAQCNARLFKKMGEMYSNAVEHSTVATNIDRKFVRCQSLRWQEMEMFIANMRSKINIPLGKIPENWESIQACISYYTKE